MRPTTALHDNVVDLNAIIHPGTVFEHPRDVVSHPTLSLSEKRWADALRYAGEALAGDPFREDMHRLTMRAFAAQGKPASVKKHFERMNKKLHAELGIEPAEETKRLFAQLIR